MDFIHQFGLAFMAFFAIMNPISSLPVYISLTSDDDSQTSKAIARKALLLAFLITTIFALIGQYIFSIFGITLPALRLAGGSLVFLIGFHMVQGNKSPTQRIHTHEEHTVTNAAHHAALPPANSEQLNIAISPLATPLLAGPGTIATAMSLSVHKTMTDTLVTIAAFGMLCIITYVLFLYAKNIVNFIGQNAMTVMTRMMGLILAVIGAQMLIDGLQGAFKVLA